MEVLQACRLEGNEGDGGAGVRFEDLKEMEVLWTCRLADLRKMEEPGSVLKNWTKSNFCTLALARLQTWGG